jgi:uncharacterized protein involved in exopolysaccharide biosynthesis
MTKIAVEPTPAQDAPEPGLFDAPQSRLLISRWPILLAATLAGGILGAGTSFLVPPTYTAVTSLIAPQQQQSAATAALASLGNIAGAVGGPQLRNPAEQYVSFLLSATVQNKLLDRFDLLKEYDEPLRMDARARLARDTRVTLGRKDGLITIEADAKNPKRAADLANAYVEELRELTGRLAVTEAKQRRLFFENQMLQAKDSLTKAEQVLIASGVGAGARRAEPRAAAESYARLKAEVTTAEVQLQTLRGSFTDDSADVRRARNTLNALRAELQALGRNTENNTGSEYVSRYREFKYREALLELLMRQYELARVDESRDGALVQVIDSATPPERKSKPKRLQFLGGGALLALLGAAAVVLRNSNRRRKQAATLQTPH